MITRFAKRTPCMEDPTLFDREIDGEAPAESNARMARAAQLCLRGCPELPACASSYQAKARPAGVIAGRFNIRYVQGRRAGSGARS